MKDVTSQYLPDDETPNPYYNATSSVDPAYMKGRFIRFSYRFRFDDGEYSIFAPFSQIAFIPQQDGSFLIGDEDATYRSSIVAFMKNKVNQIALIIPLPTIGNELFDLYKITEIDILYKESNSLAVQVLDTIVPGSEFVDGFAYKPNELAGVDGTGAGWVLFTDPGGNLNYNGYTHTGGTAALTTSLAAINGEKYQFNWTIIGRTTGTISINYGGEIINNKFRSGSQTLQASSTDVLSISPTTDFNGRVILSILPKADGVLNPYISNTNNFYNYTYQSRKPKSTLSNDQLIRVYDKVPVRALAQESSGGRVIYGNYIDKHTAPRTLNYNVALSDKGDTIKTEYPLHTVKQNRSYQIGVILSDRYGRQSDVILSTINDGSTIGDENYGGSSFYTPYRKLSDTAVLDFVGSSIKILFNDYISSTYSPLNDLGIFATGEPGLYERGGGLLSFEYGGNDTTLGSGLIDGTYENVPVTIGNNYTGATMTVVVSDGEMSVANSSITAQGSRIRLYTNINILIPDQPEEAILPVMTANNVTTPNPLGWYSYKVVVKQTQQEYYNVYLPGILNAYPAQDTTITFPTTETNKTSHTVLFSDNINKIPRDLSEVGPDQKQYRSSVRLFGRVQNTGTSTAPNNAQFFPTSISGFSVSTLANASDLGMTNLLLDVNGERNLYQLATNPIIGRISTNGQPFGVLTTDMAPYLAVVETDPIESNLDIYWETSTTGLVSDLNSLIGEELVGAYSFINVNYLQYEDQNPGGAGEDTGVSNSPYVTNSFYPVDYAGQLLITPTVVLTNVKDKNGYDITDKFSLIAGSGYTWRIKINPGAGNEFLYSPELNANQFVFKLNVVTTGVTNQLIINGSLNNNIPIINTYTVNPVYAGWAIGNPITITASGVNGSYATATNTLGLIWSFDDGSNTMFFGTAPNNFTLAMDSSGILTLVSGFPIIPITFNIKLTDSGGMFTLQSVTLDFTRGDFNIDFNTDFNL